MTTPLTVTANVEEEWYEGECQLLKKLSRAGSQTTSMAVGQCHRTAVRKFFQAQRSLLFCLPTEVYDMVVEHAMGSVRDVLHLLFAVHLVGGKQKGWGVDWMDLAKHHESTLLDNVTLCGSILIDRARNEIFTPTNVIPSRISGLRQDITYRKIIEGFPNTVSVSWTELQRLIAVDQKDHRRQLLFKSRTMRRDKDIPNEAARSTLQLHDNVRRKNAEMLRGPPLPYPGQDLVIRYGQIASSREKDERARLKQIRQDIAFKAVFHRLILSHEVSSMPCMQCLRHINNSMIGRQLLNESAVAIMGRSQYVTFCDDCLATWCKSFRVDFAIFTALRIGFHVSYGGYVEQLRRWVTSIRYPTKTELRTHIVHTISREDADSIARRYAGISWDSLQAQLRRGQWSHSQLYNAGRRYDICAKAVLRATDWYEGKTTYTQPPYGDLTKRVQVLDELLSAELAAVSRDYHKVQTKDDSTINKIFAHVAALYDAEQAWTTKVDIELHEDLRDTLRDVV